MCALQLVRLETRRLRNFSTDNRNVEWVYRILEDHQKSSSLSHAFFGDLLQVLILSRQYLGKPNRATLRAILSALSAKFDLSNGPDDERNRLTHLASVVLCYADHWFQDLHLRPMLMEDSVWPSLAGQHLPDYTILGEKLSREAEWRDIISRYPAWWLDQYPWIDCTNEQGEKFRSVLSRVWDADDAEAGQFGEEKTLVMVFMVLVNAWDRTSFSNALETLSLLKCTVTMLFSARVVVSKVQHPSQRFCDDIMGRLGGAVTRAGERAKEEIVNNPSANMGLKEGVNGVAEFLSRLVLTINDELKNPQKEYKFAYDKAKHWKGLRDALNADVVALRKKFEQMPVTDGRSVVRENSVV